MKLLKILGLICLVFISFFYTEKVISIAMEQDEIMIKIKEFSKEHNINYQNAIIDNDLIIPGSTGKAVNINASYKAMKKINSFSPTLIIYDKVYPEISIYNNYHKYIINGRTDNKNIALIYILTNDKTLDNILNIEEITNTKINFFIDSNFLNNNINIIEKIKENEIYNYGQMGKYTKDNLIITNNIINNKANNKSIYCLFINKNQQSLNNCANNKMLSLYPKLNINLSNIKNNLQNGNLILIENTMELKQIIEYIKSKGYNIVSLSDIINE